MPAPALESKRFVDYAWRETQRVYGMSESFEDDIVGCNKVPPELAAAPIVEVSGMVEALPVGIAEQVLPRASAGPRLLGRFERWRVAGAIYSASRRELWRWGNCERCSV